MTYPNEMPPQRDRYFLIPIFLLVPAALIWGVVMPAQKRMADMRARMDAANAQLEIIGHVAPLTEAERGVLNAPNASWRRRMPLLVDDTGKLHHYTRVITSLQKSFGASGAAVEGIRSSWDPIRADFTTPSALAVSQDDSAPPPSPDAEVAGWAMEVQLAQPPASLGRALNALPSIEPILLPAGLRWEAREGKPFQALILRNLYLAPPASAPAPSPAP